MLGSGLMLELQGCWFLSIFMVSFVVCLLTGGGCWLTLSPQQGQIAAQKRPVWTTSDQKHSLGKRGLCSHTVSRLDMDSLENWLSLGSFVPAVDKSVLGLFKKLQIILRVQVGVSQFAKLSVVHFFYLLLSQQPQQLLLTWFYSYFSVFFVFISPLFAQWDPFHTATNIFSQKKVEKTSLVLRENMHINLHIRLRGYLTVDKEVAWKTLAAPLYWDAA